MQKLKDLSLQIVQAIEKLLPPEISCVVVLVDAEEQDVCTLSHLPDEAVKLLLTDAIDAIENPTNVSDDVVRDAKKELN